MCFDCLFSFPPFSSSPNVGAKKLLRTLSTKSRTNTPLPEDAYGPPLSHALNQEDLPELEIDADGEVKVAEEVQGDTDSGTFDAELESEAGSTMKQDQGEDEHFVYEQDVEVETSLDTELPLDDDTDNTELEKQVLAAVVAVDHAVPGHIVANLEVHLEYDQASGGKLKVSIIKAIGVSTKEQGGFKSYRVRISLRQKKIQSSKTRIRPADSPEFKELFRFQQVPQAELSVSELVFKLNGISGKLGKERMVGSATLNLAAMKASNKQSFLIPLAAKMNSFS